MRNLSESELAALLSYVPQYEDYATWLKVIAGTLALVDGNEVLAETLLNGWQAENRPGLYRQKLRSFRGGSRGAGWLVNEAKACGWDWPKREIKDERLKIKETVSKPLTIRSGERRWFRDGAFVDAQNAEGIRLSIWVPAEYVGSVGPGDAVICRGRGTKCVDENGRAVHWTFWARSLEKVKEIKD